MEYGLTKEELEYLGLHSQENKIKKLIKSNKLSDEDVKILTRVYLSKPRI